MRHVKDKQLINFRPKAINGFDVQNCPWAGQEMLAGHMWLLGHTLPRSALKSDGVEDLLGPGPSGM